MSDEFVDAAEPTAIGCWGAHQRQRPAGVLGPAYPTTYPLAEGPHVLRVLEARASVGRLVLLP
jgi:hypothetical protein